LNGFGLIDSNSESLSTNIGQRGGAENASTGKRKYGKGKYKTAHFAKGGKRMYGKRKYESAEMLKNASTENASTMQTFSQIKKVWYFTS